MRVKSILILAPLGFVGLLFSGCVSVTKELPSYDTYKLSIQKSNLEKIKPQNIKSKNSIKVFKPVALASINSKALGYYLDDNQFESYALSKFSDTPSKMLQCLMVEYLNSTKNYKYISSSKLNLNTDYKLYSQLEAFHQVIDKNGSSVKLNISIFLKNGLNQIDFKRFEFSIPTKTKDAKGAVEALNKISNKFVKQLDIWITKKLQERSK